LRSTVPVGTSDKLGVFFMPEFLTEKNFLQDFVNNEDWIFGIPESCDISMKERFIHTLTSLFEKAYHYERISSNKLHFISARDAEMIKMSRNCFLAIKTSFCNELYQFCMKKNVNYENVRHFLSIDKRIGPSHTQVPGPDGHFGFGGTCFPKDLSSLCYEMDKEDCPSYISKAAKQRNEKIDRPEQDWKNDKGRAVVNEKV